jgi:hypothetical protein
MFEAWWMLRQPISRAVAGLSGLDAAAQVDLHSGPWFDQWLTEVRGIGFRSLEKHLRLLRSRELHESECSARHCDQPSVRCTEYRIGREYVDRPIGHGRREWRREG